MLRTVFLVKELRVDSVWIALERERVVARMGQENWRNPRLVIDHLSLGESRLGIQDFVEVGELERALVDLDFDLC